jgi:hypothetical protein
MEMKIITYRESPTGRFYLMEETVEAECMAFASLSIYYTKFSTTISCRETIPEIQERGIHHFLQQGAAALSR